MILCHIRRHIMLVCLIVDGKFDLFIVKVPTALCK